MIQKYKKVKIFSLILFAVVFLLCVFWPESQTHALTIEPLYKVLQTNSNIQKIWTEVRNLVNIVVMALLIGIAFANILRINLNNYAIKKFLPSLIMAVVLTNFSYFICRIMIDLSNVVLGLLMNGASGSGANQVASGDGGVANAFNFSGIKVDINNLWSSFIYVIAEFVGAIMIIIMAFLFFIRNYVIYFLVGISPLAFMALILPNTKSIFSSWWSMFMKWVFLPIVSVFWLWVGGIWYASGFNPSGTAAVTSQGVVPGGDFNSNLFALLFAGACYYLAITTPLKMGGSIMSGWQNLGKNLWNRTGAQAVKGGAWLANGGAASQYAAYAQRKQKLAKDTGDGINEAKWKKRATIASWVNPQSYKQGWNNRIAAAKANADKAVLKGQAYGRVAGPEAVIKAALEANLDDYVGSPAGKSAQEVAKIANAIATSNDPNVQGYWNKQSTAIGAQFDASPTLQRLVQNRGLSRDQYIKEMVANNFQTMNGAERAEIFHNALRDANGNRISDSDIGEYLAAITSYFRKGNNRDRVERDAAFAQYASSAVGTNGGTSGGQSPEATANAIEHLVDRRVEERMERTGQRVEVQADVLGQLSRLHQGDDSVGLRTAEQRLGEIQSLAARGASMVSGETSPAQINEAKMLAGQISTDFRAALNTQDPAKVQDSLKRFFEDAGSIQADNLSDQLKSFQENGNWKQSQVQQVMQSAQPEARREVLNEHFAGQAAQIDSADIEKLSDALGGHIDNLMQSNQELATMMQNNTAGQYNDMITKARNEITVATNSAIRQELMSSGSSGTNVGPQQIQEAMTKALSDPRTAKAQGAAMERALKNAPAKSQTVIHDIKPPAQSAPPTPPPPPSQA